MRPQSALSVRFRPGVVTIPFMRGAYDVSAEKLAALWRAADEIALAVGDIQLNARKVKTGITMRVALESIRKTLEVFDVAQGNTPTAVSFELVRALFGVVDAARRFGMARRDGELIDGYDATVNALRVLHAESAP